MDSDALFSSHTIDEIRTVENKTRLVCHYIKCGILFNNSKSTDSIFLFLEVTLKEKRKIYAGWLGKPFLALLK